MVDKIQNQILKDLVLEYQNSKSGILFHKILKRVDKLIVYIIYKYRKTLPYLQSEDIRDLYQASVIGISKALKLNLPENDETGDKLIARIIGYIKAEIRQEYPDHKHEVASLDSVPDLDSKFMSPDLVSKNLEIQDDINKLMKLVEKGVVSKQDFRILTKKFVEKKSYTVIGEEEGLHRTTVALRIKNALKKIRREFKE
jgi:RNA polymerase sigma factor (sigma-70 family)